MKIDALTFVIAFVVTFTSGKINAEKYRFSDKSGSKLQAYEWKPDGRVKALVFISHG